MTKIDDGGPAFPEPVSIGPAGDVYPAISGMSKRDWLAGQALPAVIAATSAGQHQPLMREGDTHIRFAIARDAYTVADAMLAERERGATHG